MLEFSYRLKVAYSNRAVSPWSTHSTHAFFRVLMRSNFFRDFVSLLIILSAFVFCPPSLLPIDLALFTVKSIAFCSLNDWIWSRAFWHFRYRTDSYYVIGWKQFAKTQPWVIKDTSFNGKGLTHSVCWRKISKMGQCQRMRKKNSWNQDQNTIEFPFYMRFVTRSSRKSAQQNIIIRWKWEAKENIQL
jgi:hypothetical protein